MRRWFYKSLLRPAALLHVFVLLAGCLSAAVPSTPRDDASPGSINGAEHLRTLPCRDDVTGLEFSPLGLAFDIMDDLYVVDSDHSRIYRALDGTDRLTAFSDCPGEYRECEFIDLAANETGGVYVSERSAGLVLALDRWGELAAFVETGPDVAGIAGGKGGRIFAALGIDGTIRMVDFDTEAADLEMLISHDDGEAYPVDCCDLGNGLLAVTDAFSGRVLFLSVLGERVGSASGFEFENPFGLACFEGRLILVSDSDRGAIAAFDSDGRFQFSFGEGVLDTPTFLDCRDDGLICVSDAGKMTIEVFRLEPPSEK